MADLTPLQTPQPSVSNGTNFFQRKMYTKLFIFLSIFFSLTLAAFFFLNSIHEYALCGDIPDHWPNVACDKRLNDLLSLGQLFSGILVFLMAFVVFVNNISLLKILFKVLVLYTPIVIFMYLYGAFSSFCLMGSCYDGVTPMLGLAVSCGVVLVLSICWSSIFRKQIFAILSFCFFCLLFPCLVLGMETQINKINIYLN